ncbi:MAG: hypothetical protein WC627_12550, partial [Legionella sp.]
MFNILYKEFLRRYTDWLDPFSSQLLDRLKADDGSLHPDLALEYLLQYPDKVPNLYVSKTMSFIKQDVSLIESSLACCWDPHYRGAGIALFETILERAKHVKDHDETIAGKVMEWALISELRSKELGSAPNKPYALLFNFYKDKLSQIDINDVSSFFVHQQSPQDAFAHHFEDFPPHQIWRLFIDAKLQKSENGWLDYEHREPGALMAMLNCIKFLEDNISALVNIDLLKNIQKLCSSSVNNLTSEIYPGEFRDNEKVGYGLKMGKNLSLRGFFELDSNITQGDKDYYFTHDKINDCRFESRALSTEEIN